MLWTLVSFLAGGTILEDGGVIGGRTWLMEVVTRTGFLKVMDQLWLCICFQMCCDMAWSRRMCQLSCRNLLVAYGLGKNIGAMTNEFVWWDGQETLGPSIGAADGTWTMLHRFPFWMLDPKLLEAFGEEQKQISGVGFHGSLGVGFMGLWGRLSWSLGVGFHRSLGVGSLGVDFHGSLAVGFRSLLPGSVWCEKPQPHSSTATNSSMSF